MITIDKDFQNLIPPLTDEEFAQLEKNILRDGIRDALITWHGILIDGHNRYRIAQKYGLTYRTVEKHFTDRNDAERWIILNQFGRRNLSAYDRSILALKLKPIIAEKAKENQLSVLKQNSGTSVCQKSDRREIDTKKELAKVAGVSHDTIAKVEKIQAKASPEIKSAIKSGEMSINQAYQTVKREEKKQEVQKRVVEDDFDEEPPAEPIAKYGDLYQLGRHRLMCGDSTKIDDVARLMDGAKADMVFTDPPYGVSYEGGLNEKKKKQIKNDALTGNDLYNMLYGAFTNIKLATKEKSGIYIFYATKTTREFINALFDSGLKQRGIIAWHKLGGGFGDYMAHYMNAYEPCIYASNGESVNWYGASNEKTLWEIDKEKSCDLHPTMKPIAVVSRAVQNSSKNGDGVLDLFGGSGSTLIACEQLNRKCYMMELDPKYIDVIINRWETFTGQKAVKLNAD